MDDGQFTWGPPSKPPRLEVALLCNACKQVVAEQRMFPGAGSKFDVEHRCRWWTRLGQITTLLRTRFGFPPESYEVVVGRAVSLDPLEGG